MDEDYEPPPPFGPSPLTLAPVISKAPPLRPRPSSPRTCERGVPRRLWEMNSDPVLLSSLTPLWRRRWGGVSVERNAGLNPSRVLEAETHPKPMSRGRSGWGVSAAGVAPGVAASLSSCRGHTGSVVTRTRHAGVGGGGGAHLCGFPPKGSGREQEQLIGGVFVGFRFHHGQQELQFGFK